MCVVFVSVKARRRSSKKKARRDGEKQRVASRWMQAKLGATFLHTGGHHECHVSVDVPYVEPQGPVYEWMCCKTKQCCKHVSEKVVNDLRATLWSGELTSETVKELIWAARDDVLRLPSGHRPCMVFLLRAADVSINFLYKEAQQNQAEANGRRSRADVCIMAWFELLLPIADKMPDDDW